VYSADPNVKPNPSEAVETPESVWNNLDAQVRERALRILSELCYAHLRATDIDSALENDNSEMEPVSKNEAAF
jgi:hypothetical protein